LHDLAPPSPLLGSSLCRPIPLSAVLLASVLGLPLGAALAVLRFPGETVIVNALMGLPPVVAGLFVYVVLSRSGPLGNLGLLFTPAAMVIAQTVLVAPIVAAIARQVVEDLWREYGELYVVDGVGIVPCRPKAVHHCCVDHLDRGVRAFPTSATRLH
jgi:tungstate transport system permease protein